MRYDTKKEGPALIFDGVCELCNSTVDFIVRWEKSSELKFLPWQSPLGEAVLKDLGLWRQVPDALVLLTGDRVLRGSDAALEASRYLRFPMNLFRWALWIPRFLREPVYRGVARIRYRWFGKRETCRLPSPELRARFLSDRQP